MKKLAHETAVILLTSCSLDFAAVSNAAVFIINPTDPNMWPDYQEMFNKYSK